MRIDKWRSVIFDEDEIDFISDAIEGLLFKEFFSESNTLLTIACLAGDNESQLMRCTNKPEYWLELESALLEKQSFAKLFYVLGDTTPGYGVLANRAYLTGEKIDFTMSVANSDYGTIIAWTTSEASAVREESILGLYGLNLVMARLLAMREDEGASDLYAKIRSTFIAELNIPRRMFEIASEKVETLFS